MITSGGKNLIFLLGLPRSGTTLLSALLNNHPAVDCPPEPWLMIALESLGAVPQHHPSDAAVLFKAFHEFSDAGDHLKAARAYAMTAYKQRLRRNDKAVLVDKSPRYHLILPFLSAVFPRAKFILLLRNPLDVAASMKQTWFFDLPRSFREKDDSLGSIDLAVGMRRLWAFASNPKNKVHLLRYEELVRRPEPLMQGVFNFIGVEPLTGEQLTQFDLSQGKFAKSVVGDKKILQTHAPHPQSIDSWKRSYQPEEVATLLEAIGPQLMRDLGYGQSLDDAEGLGVILPPEEPALAHYDRLEAAVTRRFGEYQSSVSFAGINQLQGDLALRLDVQLPDEPMARQRALIDGVIRLQASHQARLDALQQELSAAQSAYWTAQKQTEDLTERFREFNLVNILTHREHASMAGQNENLMAAALAHLVAKGFVPKVVLDIGAAKGYWSEVAQWKFFRNAEYMMIDPLVESEKHLQELKARKDAQFDYILTALGKEPGTAVINLSGDYDGSSLLDFPENQPALQRRTIAVETIDNLLERGQIKAPDLVKMDVKGFELEVLAGASKLFGAAEVFIIEVSFYEFMPKNPLAHEVISFMARQGYRIFDIAGTLHRPFEHDLAQMDIIFVKNDSQLMNSTRWA